MTKARIPSGIWPPHPKWLPDGSQLKDPGGSFSTTALEPARGDSSADRFPDERDDPGLSVRGQRLERESGRPHVAVVELRFIAESERSVSGLELLRALKEADHIAVLRIGGHPVPGSRHEVRRGGGD